MKARRSPGVRLDWKGRSWEPNSSNSVQITPAVVERVELGAGKAVGGQLVAGDVLQVAEHLRRLGMAGSVKLAYVDPPYLSQADYEHEARLDGPADGRVRRAAAYGERGGESDGGVGAYLDMLAPRLDALASLLCETGTLWVQLDWRATYLARVVMDEIFGREGFTNEIVWRRAPNLGRQAASGQFGRTLDSILVYGGPKARLSPPTRLEPIEPGAVRWDDAGRPFTTAPRGDYTDLSVARLEAEGRIHRTATGKVYVKYFLVKDHKGTLCRERRIDALWTDVPPLRHASVGERTGYPTQKPVALLERIIACATAPGELVVDLFAGSGTTGEAAHRLGRRFVLGDASPMAIATARARLLRAGSPLSIESVGVRPEPSAPPEVGIEVGADGAAHVELLAPKEPLAWAVGILHGDGACDVLWHAERKPGARPVAAPVATTLQLPKGATSLFVRAFEDDGTVREGTFAVRMPKGRGARAPRSRT